MKKNDEDFSRDNIKLLILVMFLLLIGIVVGVFQNKIRDFTASVVSDLDKDSLFNVGIDIPQEYKKIEPGEKLLTSIKLINLGAEKRVDVFLDYEIKDINGNLVLSQSETAAVETQANLVRYFTLSQNIPNGYYEIFAKLKYKDKEAMAKSSFEVANNKYLIGNYIYLISGLFILVILSAFWSSHIKIIIRK